MQTRPAIVLIVAVAALCAPAAFAQHGPAGQLETYPGKPVRVVVGLAPGGATDVQARVFSQKLSDAMGRQFVVDNRPGAGESIAILTVGSAAPDGYTLLATTPSFTIGPAFYDKPPYDPLKDFVPISLVTKAPFMVVVQSSFAARSITELIAFARTKPGALLFATGGLGTPIHLGGAWLGYLTNTNITIVPYKGTAPALSDLLAGQIHVTFANPITSIPLVKAGRLRALAVTGAERSRVMPDLPTVAESGIPDYDVVTWHGWLAPKGTPGAIVSLLNTALTKFVKAPEIAERVAADGGETVGNSAAQFQQVLTAEVPRWRKLVKETGMRLE